ncbi:HNH endonuclease signature motif containing protein [Herbiconiux sp. P15]|uniref:HNH endonuclease signature motif containing protein n=1 Tax=Herbiconiux liukaitaii TaxID=3342799 RepID=UPI0035BA7641
MDMSDDQVRKRLRPTSATARELYLYSGNRCAFPGCSRPLLKKNGTWNCEIAHIHGVMPTSARGQHDLTNEQLRSPSNLLLLCLDHHNEVDNKALDAKFTVQVVKKMKADHEALYREAIIAGLERIVDVTMGIEPTYPSNLGAVGDFDDEMLPTSLADLKRYIDEIADQPAGFRDLLALILIYGKPRPSSKLRPPIAIPAKFIAGKVTLGEAELTSRALHLREANLLDIYEDEGIVYFELKDPHSDISWDLFGELYELANGDRSAIERAIVDLDFSLFQS